MQSSPKFSDLAQLSLPFDTPPEPEEVFARVFQRLGLKHPAPAFKVAFHPYANLRSTIRVTSRGIHARISDVAASAPVIVLEALAEVLLASLFRRRPSREARECYMAWTFEPAVRARVDANRRARGFKLMHPPRGQHYNLEEIFHHLNRDYFQARLPLPRLGWSLERSSTMLGHHDSAHGAIIISRILDSPAAPLEVVEYLMYHEMLHMVYPVQRSGSRRIIHTKDFQAAERRFPNYSRVQQALKSLLQQSRGQRRRTVRRRRRGS
jgi:SprT-like family